MGVKYVCRHCGYVIWEFKHVGQDYFGIPTPSEILLATGGICPRCKRELHVPSIEDIVIKPRISRHTIKGVYVSKMRNVDEQSYLSLGGISRRGDFMAAQEI